MGLSCLGQPSGILSSQQKCFERGAEPGPIVVALQGHPDQIHLHQAISAGEAKGLCVPCSRGVLTLSFCADQMRSSSILRQAALTSGINKAQKNVWHFCKECSPLGGRWVYDGNSISSCPRMSVGFMLTAHHPGIWQLLLDSSQQECH